MKKSGSAPVQYSASAVRRIASDLKGLKLRFLSFFFFFFVFFVLVGGDSDCVFAVEVKKYPLEGVAVEPRGEREIISCVSSFLSL